MPLKRSNGSTSGCLCTVVNDSSLALDGDKDHVDKCGDTSVSVDQVAGGCDAAVVPPEEDRLGRSSSSWSNRSTDDEAAEEDGVRASIRRAEGSRLISVHAPFAGGLSAPSSQSAPSLMVPTRYRAWDIQYELRFST